jgi:hypothetical protein
MQGLMLVNTIYFLVLSLNTMPLYSLVVQMGGDYKHGLMPRDLQTHMALVARERDEVRHQLKYLPAKLEYIAAGVIHCTAITKRMWRLVTVFLNKIESVKVSTVWFLYDDFVGA